MRHKKNEPSMNEDIQKYPCYMYYKTGDIGTMIPADWITSTESYVHGFNNLQLHHFVPKTIRKNNPQFYERVEHLQRLILMPAQMNYDLEHCGIDYIYKNWKVYKYNFIFNREKWREGFYD